MPNLPFFSCGHLQKCFIVLVVVALETGHAEDIWLCVSGSEGGGGRPEGSETERLHPGAGEEKYCNHCKCVHGVLTLHWSTDHTSLRSSSLLAVVVRGSNTMTKCFLVFELLWRFLKITSTCWKSLTPVTAVGMWTAMWLRPPGNMVVPHSPTVLCTVLG